MKVTYAWFGLCFALCSLLSCAEKKNNVLTKSEIDDGWELLFDGKTLNGWKGYNNQSSSEYWEVVDGCIQAKSTEKKHGGFLVTKKEYENFEFSCDWKLSKNGNSGLIYHVMERPQHHSPYLTGPEYQLIDEDGDKFKGKLVWNCLGADYMMYVPDKSKKKVNPQGEWNNSKIVFDNGHVEYWMNGSKIVEFEAWSDDWYERKSLRKWKNVPEYGLFKKGLLCLQDHGDPASFRNLKIKELPRKSKKQNLFEGEDLKKWQPTTSSKWVVNNNTLSISDTVKTNSSYLLSREYFDDFEITAQVKSPITDLGLYLRTYVNGKSLEGAMIRLCGDEANNGLLILKNDQTEQKSKISSSVLKPSFKKNEWNDIRIQTKGSQITVWINNAEVLNANSSSLASLRGAVGLISNTGNKKCLWKNISIKTM